MNLYYVELDGDNEFCNESYVLANNVLEAETKAKDIAKQWDDGRPYERKAKKILYLAREVGRLGVMMPVLII